MVLGSGYIDAAFVLGFVDNNQYTNPPAAILTPENPLNSLVFNY